MGYIENNLVKGEEIIYKTKLHWLVIIRPALSLFILSSASIYLLTLYLSPLPGGNFPLALTVAIFPATLGLVAGLIRYSTSEFGLTNRRVLIKVGWLRRQTLELNLGRIESFQAHEPILGRLLGFSDLTLTGSGGTRQTFKAVANGSLFRKRVVEFSTEAEKQYQQAPYQPPYAAPTASSQKDLFAEIAAKQYEHARRLYQSGKREQAIGILEALAEQGYTRAQQALHKIRTRQ